MALKAFLKGTTTNMMRERLQHIYIHDNSGLAAEEKAQAAVAAKRILQREADARQHQQMLKKEAARLKRLGSAEPQSREEEWAGTNRLLQLRWSTPRDDPLAEQLDQRLAERFGGCIREAVGW